MSGAASLAITGGRIVPVLGEPVERGNVVIVDGVIRSVGAAEPPSGIPTFDAGGCWVMPGFVDAHTHVGINEESAGPAGADNNEASAPNTAGVRAIDAVNIEDPGFRDALEGGVTSVIVRPGSSNPIGGLTVAMKTWGGQFVDDQVIVDGLSLKSALGENPKTVFGELGQEPKTRMGIAHVIRQAFEDARDPSARSTLHSLAIGRVLDGEIPWDVHAHRHDDIATALRLAAEFGVRLVIQHGTEAHRFPERLAAAGIPVVYGPTMSPRSKVELAERSAECITGFVEAGVQFAITTDHPELPLEFLVNEATYAVKDGLDPDAAIAAITTSPAAIYGLDDRIGALKPGADGDVVIWSGDPLDMQQRAEQVFIEGRLVFDRCRDSPVIERRELHG